MPLPAKQYWERRAEEVLLAAERRGNGLADVVAELYGEATRAIQRDTDAFYGRYADKEGISLQEARRRLNPQELLSFREQNALYYAEAKRLGLSRDYQTYLRELSAKAYVSRQQELMANIRHEVESMAGRANTAFTSALGDTYGDSYYRTIFDVQQGLGFGASFTLVDSRALQSAIGKPWLGSNYSDRIWTNKEKLLGELDRVMGQSFALGKNSREIGRDLARRMGVSAAAGERLVRTEVNHACNQAALDSYRAAGVVEYKFLATLDNRTSEICAALDGQRFRVADAQPGVNLPPMHPNCRSTIVPYFPPGEFDVRLGKERIARGEEGSYYVPRDMTYEEWRAAHVDKKPDGATITLEVMRFTSAVGIDAAFATQEKAWRDTLSDDEQAAVRAYTEPDYVTEQMNAALRRGDTLKDEQLKRSVELTAALGKWTVDAPFIVYRGTFGRELARFDLGSLPGKILSGLGYQSTSLLRDEAFDFTHLYEIVVRPGTRGALIRSVSEFAHEQEYLLDKSVRLKVLDVRQVDGKTIIRAEVIVNGDDGE